MIIKELELISFGKFENKIISLSETLNVIGGDNESGKSTIMDFIYIMLYGFGDNRGKTLSLRERYKPWSGAPCEGKMTLVLDDKEITIYRKAGLSKKNDECKVYDTLLGTPLKINPESILGITADTFKKTLHISQLLTAINGESSEIAQKLSNISTSGQEDTNFDKAISIMELMRREIKPLRGSGGELAKIEAEILDATKNEEIIKSHQAQISTANQRLSNTKALLEQAKSKYEALLNSSPSDEAAKLSGRIEEKKNYCSEQKNLLELKKNALNLLDDEECGSAYSGKALKPLLYTFAALTLVSLVASFLSVYSLIFTIGFLCAFVVTYLKNKKITDSIIEKELLSTQKREALISEIDKINAIFQNESSQLSELIEKYNALKRKRDAEDNSRKEAEQNYIELSNSVASLEALISHLNTQDISLKAVDLPQLSKRREELKSSLSATEAAISALTAAHNEMQQSFTPMLNKKASEYFAQITNEKYTSLFTDESFNINVGLDIPRDSSHFSGGTIDQMYLALRLALTDMLFGDSKVFILLDQPFIQYDDSRKENTFNLLKKLSNNRQVIIFTSDKDIIASHKETEILT